MNWLARLVLLGTALAGAGILIGELTTPEDLIRFAKGWIIICLIVMGARWVGLRRAQQ